MIKHLNYQNLNLEVVQEVSEMDENSKSSQYSRNSKSSPFRKNRKSIIAMMLK